MEDKNIKNLKKPKTLTKSDASPFLLKKYVLNKKMSEWKAWVIAIISVLTVIIIIVFSAFLGDKYLHSYSYSGLIVFLIILFSITGLILLYGLFVFKKQDWRKLRVFSRILIKFIFYFFGFSIIYFFIRYTIKILK